jgi:hypothetical protein
LEEQWGDGGAAVCQTGHKIAKSINKFEFLKQVSIKISNNELVSKFVQYRPKCLGFIYLSKMKSATSVADLQIRHYSIKNPGSELSPSPIPDLH